METGYSLLLGEFLAAREVDHGDCATFQVVCPACREAVFKAGALGTPRQYLSHHRKADDAECELRVACITQAEREAAEAVARGQHLAVFQRVYQGALLAVMTSGPPRHMVGAINRMKARPTFGRFVQLLRTANAKEPEALTRMADDAPQHFPGASPLVLRRQRRFAVDFYGHLMTANAEASIAAGVALRLMAEHAGCRRRLAGPDNAGRDLCAVLSPVFEAFCLGSERDLRKALDAARQQRIDGFKSVLSRVVNVVLEGLYCDLLCLPFVEMLRPGWTPAGMAPVMRAEHLRIDAIPTGRTH